MTKYLSQKDFETALAIMKKPGGKKIKFLKLHSKAKGRVSTMRRLAEQVGYKSWRGMNLQYGILARDIGLAAGLKEQDLPYPDIALLVDFIAPAQKSSENISNSEWILVMREPFAKALAAIGWT
jgi:hypothetical protein